jgi:hypothetical protein
MTGFSERLGVANAPLGFRPCGNISKLNINIRILFNFEMHACWVVATKLNSKSLAVAFCSIGIVRKPTSHTQCSCTTAIDNAMDC